MEYVIYPLDRLDLILNPTPYPTFFDVSILS